MKLKKIALALAVSGLMVPGLASATNGYFSHGYGMKAKGMGGAATAMADDAFGGANNPATMVFAGDRFDIGVDWFRPMRSAKRDGVTPGAGSLANASADSGSNDFFIPEFGYNRMLSSRMSLGVTVYGNGGMNTDYPGGQSTVATSPACAGFNSAGAGGSPYNLLCGSGKLGVDLMQLVIAPTLAYKINERHSIGVSPLFGYQRFKADGLQGFVGYTSSGTTNNLTNVGYDDATGWGVRIGYYGQLTDIVSIGAAYSSKISMSKFDKYKELFAEQGAFDMPENWNLGIAIKATPKTTVAVDYQRINYSGVKSIANPSTNGGLTIGGTLGGDNGRGFGWSDVSVWKFGIEHAYSDKLTLRVGYSHGDNPIQSRDVTFNIIAPGVVTDHYTLGFTYNLDKESEITMSYMHAKENSVQGASLFTNWLGAANSGTETIKMYQDSLGIAYGKKF